MKFLADTMLGTLARWLRVLGFDTVYANDSGDKEILELAIRENRTILSRDRELCSRKEGSIYIDSKDLDSQISQVVALFPASEKLVLTRCLDCNSLLVSIPQCEAIGHVPGGVSGRYDEFWKCGTCDKYFWHGSHWQNMKRKAELLCVQRFS
uniref:Mut7-C RNAse domain-containing protein n=1 Tax=uncultured Thermoplasmata archaeon TaxID=376542 RepID=A0A871Y7L4_9ARCH|nr:hypothetical protein HULAa36F11_00025 [uncultured Thermoplasmata archaeon]